MSPLNLYLVGGHRRAHAMRRYNVHAMNQLPKRCSIRLPGFDYSSGRSYFVTCCVEDRVHLFGSVTSGEMHRNEFGEIAEAEWQRTSEIRSEFIAHAHVIMPNHVHLLFSLDPTTRIDSVGEHGMRPPPAVRLDPDRREFRRTPRSVGTIVGGYKSAVTSQLRKLVGDERWKPWQRNFFERIVRDETDFNTILQYIELNPANWQKDRFFSRDASL
jgi:REP element-mobilizing transposase RayT